MCIRDSVNGESIWFERLWSPLDTLSPGSPNAIEAVVGQRINPPAGHESAIGYIHQPTGTAFDPTAYINPFVAGGEAAPPGRGPPLRVPSTTTRRARALRAARAASTR